MNRSTLKQAALPSAIAAALALPSPAVHAAKCSEGGLVFLGKTSDQSVSVWASKTAAGSFALEAPGKDVVDTWDRARRGVHISLSPVVSPGNGSPHSLVDTVAGCEIAKVNQKGGVTFPPDISLPPKLPPNLRPPGSRPSPPGLMPTLPTLPPTGVMPTVPTAPPTGVMPTVPTAPPTGVMPTVPTVPPTGVMPTVPTAPPTGVMPTVPTAPPTGMMPTAPTVPPSGVMPTVPTAPPTGVTPSVPGGITPGAPAELTPDREGPLTRGREFVQAPGWNFWMDGRATDSEDRRFGLDIDAAVNHLTIGADRMMNDGLVVGLMVLYEKTDSDGFGGDLSVDSEAVGIGPYFARRLSPEWTADASITFSLLENDEQLSVLTASYESQRFVLSTSATGDYSFGEARFYPRVTMSYTILRNEEHDMGGTVMGIPLSVRVADTEVDFGLVEATAELTRGYGAGSTVWYPFAEVGVRFEFERPDGGRIITGSLTLEETSPWVGSVRAGVRLLPSRQVFIEAGAGYLSLGQNDLDVLEGSIYVSIGF